MERERRKGCKMEKKITLITAHPKMSAEYSARNKKAKLAPPYSVL